MCVSIALFFYLIYAKICVPMNKQFGCNKVLDAMGNHTHKIGAIFFRAQPVSQSQQHRFNYVVLFPLREQHWDCCVCVFILFFSFVRLLTCLTHLMIIIQLLLYNIALNKPIIDHTLSLLVMKIFNVFMPEKSTFSLLSEVVAMQLLQYGWNKQWDDHFYGLCIHNFWRFVIGGW